MVRMPSQLLPHAGGILFQQWVCDAYSRAEANALNWFRLNQDQLRAESYQGLYDAVHAGSQNIGKLVVLPATFPGCPRNLQQNYMDAMAIVRKFGKPDYFITMTANPAWPEVLEQLRPPEMAHDRPDIPAYSASR